MNGHLRPPEPEHRRLLQPVRRHSVPAGSEAQAQRRRARPDMGAWFAAARRRVERDARGGGGWRRHHHAALIVAEKLLGLLDKRTGRLDPSYDTLMRLTGFCRQVVAQALALLRDEGLLGWVRRFRHVEGEGRAARYAQTSNAYWFELPAGAQALLSPKRRPPPPCEAELERRRQADALRERAEAEACVVGDPNRPAAVAQRLRAQAPPADEGPSVQRMLRGVGRQVRV